MPHKLAQFNVNLSRLSLISWLLPHISDSLRPSTVFSGASQRPNEIEQVLAMLEVGGVWAGEDDVEVVLVGARHGGEVAALEKSAQFLLEML